LSKNQDDVSECCFNALAL